MRVAVRVGRVLGATLYVATALFGALFTPWPSMLLVAPLTGAVVAGLAALVRPDSRTDAAARRMVVHAAVAGVLAVPSPRVCRRWARWAGWWSWSCWS